MKRIIFILLTGIMFINYLPAQEEVPVNEPTATEAERIIDKYTDKVWNGVEDIASQLEGPAKEAFSYVVKLQIAKGIGMLLPAFLFIVCTIIFTLGALTVKDTEDPKFITPVVFGIIGLLMFVVSLFSTYDGILHLIAPEWYAVVDIINLVK